MNDYLDSSALVKLYIPEAESAMVSERVSVGSAGLACTFLQELETRNALRLKLFRGEATLRQIEGALAALAADLADGIFTRREPDWAQVFERAEELSGRHSPRLGARSADILHVALALVLRCRNFVTFDDRQAQLAEKAGLVRVPKSLRRAGR